MVIFIFLVRKYPFCVNLIQKFKRVILKQNLVLLLSALICRFFSPRTFFFHPLSPTQRLLIIGECFQPQFETIYLC